MPKWSLFVAAASLALSIPAAGQQSLFQLPAQRQTGESKEDFPLTEQPGPWMVKVCSFSGTGSLAYANLVARELREKHKIDAYTYRYRAEGSDDRPTKEFLDAFEKRYQVRPRVGVLNTRPPENWVVLAGDFDAADSADAQRMMKKIKRIETKAIPLDVWKEQRPGKPDASYARPYTNPILIRNPLGPKAMADGIDNETAKMLLALNAEEPLSVYNNAAPLTIMVKQFQGKAVFEKKNQKKDWKESLFGDKNTLEKAGHDAILLADHLRKLGVEAYVFHGKFASVVCVGGYQERSDPRLTHDFQKLGEIQLGELRLEPQIIETPRRPTLIEAAPVAN